MDYNDNEETRLVAGEPVVDPQWSEAADFLSELRLAFPPEATSHLEERHLTAILNEYQPGSATTPETLVAAPGRTSPRLRRVFVTALASGVAALSLGINSAAAMGVDPVGGLVQVARAIVPEQQQPQLPPPPGLRPPPSSSPSKPARAKQPPPPTLRPAAEESTAVPSSGPILESSSLPSVSSSPQPTQAKPTSTDSPKAKKPKPTNHGGGRGKGRKAAPTTSPTSEEG